MNWKSLFQKSLGEVITGKETPPEKKARRRYFWQVPGDLIHGRKARTGDDALYSPSLLRRTRSLRWRGPLYWSGRAWRQDVLLVAEYARSLVATNAPLAGGMAAAAREEHRRRHRWTPQRVSRVALGVLLVVYMVLVGSGIVRDQNGLGGSTGGVQVLILALAAFWFIRLGFFMRHRRMAVFLAMEHRLSSGLSLSDAMAGLPRFFPRHLVDLVVIGEETGDLDHAFAEFNGPTLRALGHYRQLNWVLRYLAFVLVVQIGILSFLSIKVVPVYVEMREELATTPEGPAPLPFLNAAIALHEFITKFGNHWHKFAFVGLIIVAWYVLRRYRGRRHWGSGLTVSILSVVPWFRGLVIRQNLGLIALMLHGLLRRGVTLDRALGLCSSADLHPAYRRWLVALRESLRGGDSLREALAQNRPRRLVPDSFVGQVEAGEYAGQLPAMFERIAGLYQQEADRRMRILVASIFPLGIFILGYITMAAEVLGFKLIVDMADTLIV